MVDNQQLRTAPDGRLPGGRLARLGAEHYLRGVADTAVLLKKAAMKFANSAFGREHNLRGVNAKVVKSEQISIGNLICRYKP